MSASDVRKWHPTFFSIAAVMTYVLVFSGGVVCLTDSSRGCPDWPSCNGGLTPPMQMNSIIEYVHRLGAAVTLPFLIVAAVIGWRQYRSVRWVIRPLLAAIVSLLAVAFFGAMVILYGLPRGWAAVDLGLALLTLALMVTAAVVVSARTSSLEPRDRLSFASPFARLAVATAVSVYAVLVSCVLVARPGSVTRCLNWPGFAGLSIPKDVFGWLQLTRLGLAYLASLLIAALVVQAWRTQRRRTAIVRNATAVGGLLLVSTIVGAMGSLPAQNVALPLASMLSAGALWAFLAAVLVRAGLEA